MPSGSRSRALGLVLGLNAVASAAAALVLAVAPGAIPGVVGVPLLPSQTLLAYLLAAAELGLATLAGLALRAISAEAARHAVWVLIVFHAASGLAGACAVAEGPARQYCGTFWPGSSSSRRSLCVGAGRTPSRGPRRPPTTSEWGKAVMDASAQIEIRQVRPGDEALFDRVAEDVFDAPIDRARLAAYLAEPSHHMLVALHAGEVVAQVAAVVHRHPDKPAELYIDEVGVTPALQRQGIARRMLDAMFALGKALGCEEAWVGTEPSNGPARALYEGRGASAEPVVMYAYDL